LFHYAHFLCDCLYPEVIYELYRQPCVYRVKSVGQTLGGFISIYEDVMRNKTIELEKNEFDSLKDTTIVVRNIRQRNKHNKQLHHMPVFRNYVFQRYNINPNVYDAAYPSVVLIKRGQKPLLTDPDLIAKANNKLVYRNGYERREIMNIDQVEQFLQRYHAKTYVFEDQPFKEQVKIFNNAKVIILAHGAAMSNMFFCKKGTTIIEVTCGTCWRFFDVLSRVFELNHVKVRENRLDAVIAAIQTVL
jgi:hypothetical protein